MLVVLKKVANPVCTRAYSKAEAPEIISISSRVMTACRVRLNVSVSLSIISPAFLLALSMALMRDDCSEQALSFIVKKTSEASENSR